MHIRAPFIASIFLMASAVVLRADDASAAKSGGVAFFRAMADEDSVFVEDHFAGGPADRKLLSVFRDLVRDGNALRAACTKRFGADAAKAGIGAFDPSQMAADIDKFEAVEKDGMVQLHRPGSKDDGLVMQADKGVWKVQSLAGSPGKAAQLTALMLVFDPVLKDTTRAVEAGAYKTIADVKTAFVARQRAAMQEYVSHQTTRPAS